ncbi:hypothetical protein ALI144C_39015 [Actinosynnema sp. ALI-1.44]|uniref:hypothetical protein n=1 Tax=Actinosynnema sp. ALI-1.44 TaxID=1933779 RepID=UPI00097CB55D|nr:hypothetical protein ALI144C_39015 [Actinosynnema sp. ALI-1.44]
MPHRRVAVTSPQTRLAHARKRLRARWRVPVLDPADAERAQRLFRVQRRRAAAAVGWLFALVLLLPLVFALWPRLDTLHLLGIPVSWLMVVLIPFPAMVFLAVWQLRRAEKPEDEE